MQERVSISKEEYAYLLENTFKYGVLLDSIYAEADDFHWSQEILIDNEQVGKVLKVIDKERYLKKINEIEEQNEGKVRINE